MRFGTLFSVLVFAAAPVVARHGISGCGTTGETANEMRFLHRQSVRARSFRALAPSVAPANRDAGNIAIIEDSDGVVARQNPFDLDLKTLSFIPSAPDAAHYRYSVSAGGYDAAAADAGTPLIALDDDDTRQLTLPFPFPFFGTAYTQVFVNSDGNLTFTTGDNASSERSLGRMTAGPPRIAPLFDDLDPSRATGGVRVSSNATRVVVSWVKVPEWEDTGIGPAQTFQARLYPDGRIEFSYSGASPSSASVVGIAPGNLKGATSLVSFRNDPSGDYSAAVTERFGNDLAVDTVTAAQKFYQTHEDAYDYLMVYNNEGIPAMPTAVAYENTVRSSGSGYAVDPVDAGRQYGSASRLQAVINMGHLSQYPKDPNGIVQARLAAGDTPLTVLAHETGHLFLAFASVRDPNNPSARPMLNTDRAHWSFVFNSEASLLEGERIEDRGPSTSPEFLTTDTVQAYAPLDQYLMGFTPPEPVKPTFLVTGAPAYLLGQHPVRGYPFDGTRQDIAIGDIIQAEGRRTPDYTVAQHRFHFGFLLVVPQGSEPSAADLAQVDTYRRQFEEFYANASANIGSADTALQQSMKLSLFPSAGVVVGGAPGTASLTLETAPSADMTVQLQAPKGIVKLPASVTIPAGARSATFSFSGLRTGVEDVLAVTPPGTPYETAFARVQVADAPMLTLLAVSGDHQISTGASPLPEPIVVRLTDTNNLPYPGAQIRAAASAGGDVAPASAATDAQGRASFRWTPGTSPANTLTLALDPLPSVGLTLTAGAAVPLATAVVNAASSVSGVAAGALETVWGVNLAGGQTITAGTSWPKSLGGVTVQLNGSALPLLYVSDTQINFYVPKDAPQGSATLTVTTPSGIQAATGATVVQYLPGIFPGAVLRAGTTVSAVTSAVHAGDYLEIYCTGLGPTQTLGGLEQTLLTPTVFIGAVPVQPVYSGLAPGFGGLYQVDVQVPQGLAPGSQPLSMSVNLAHSNEVTIAVQ